MDLSKAFDRVHWPALWKALVDERIPDHLVWILNAYISDNVVKLSVTWAKHKVQYHTRRAARVRAKSTFFAVLQWAIREMQVSI